MTHLLGAIIFMLICVRFLNKGHKMWVEQHTPISKVVSVIHTIVAIAAGIYAYMAIDQFLIYMEWK